MITQLGFAKALRVRHVLVSLSRYRATPKRCEDASHSKTLPANEPEQLR